MIIKAMMTLAVHRLVLLWVIFSVSVGLDREDLYTYGNEVGDRILVVGDESKDLIEFPSRFGFYSRSYGRAYVDTNGLISLGRAFRTSKQFQDFPIISPPLIAPFWCDANTRYSGSVYYRVVNESNDAYGLLERARQEVMRYFIDSQDFVPAYILIVTWEDIGYMWNSTLTNTFQAVLMSDGTESFACFLYPSNEISWPPIDQYPYAIAGFNYGNKIRFYTQPHSSSHDILDIEESSNIHFNGKWLYRINLYRIDPPPYNQIADARILLWPPDMEVEKGSLVSFMCTATGWPIPFVTITKEESLMNNPRFTFAIIPEDFFTVSVLMNLTEAGVGDTGDYTCRAVAGEAGEERQNQKVFFIGVLDSPTITSITTDNSFISGTDQNLECIALGYPRPNIYWISDSISFNTGYGGSNYTLAPYTENLPIGYTVLISILTLHPVIPDDHGTYTCIVTNSEGETNASVEITVFSSPEVVTRPSDVDLNAGDTHKFTCVVRGRPLPDIVWEKNGVTLSNSTSVIISRYIEDESTLVCTITLVNATLEHIGVYECNAANRVGSNSATFNVTVYAAAAIISLSHETYILVNSSVVLGCVAHGNPPPLGIMWRTTSSHYTITELSNFTAERVVDDFTVISNLTLSFVALESRGEYTCVAYNEIQMTQVSDEEAVGLFVVAKPVIASISSLRKTSHGANVLLICTVVGYPLSDTVWIKESEETYNGNVSQTFVDDITLTSQLLIQHVTLDDAGTYLCMANNSVGMVFAMVDVIVEAPPNITYISPQVIVTQYVNRTVVFRCVARGYPSPTMTWTFGLYKLRNNTSQESVSTTEVVSELVVDYITLYQQGNYTCHADNSEGSESATAELIVQARPYVSTDETEIMVAAGSNVTLMCSVIANPEPNILWSMDMDMNSTGGSISETMQMSSVRSVSMLTLQRVTLYNNGIYNCSANNSVGYGEISIELIVSAPPLINFISPANSTFENGEIVLRCEVLGFPLASITWISDAQANHSVEYLNFQSTVYEVEEEYMVVSELTLQNVNLDFRGNYTCQASNSLGEVDEVSRVLVYASPAIFLSPRDVEVFVHENVTLQCISSGYPRPEISWLRNEEVVYEIDEYVFINQYIINDITLASVIYWRHIISTEAGVYTCVATNTVGSAATDVELTILEPPHIIDISYEVTASIDDTVQLQCVATGNPTPSITWTHNGDSLNESSQSVGQSVRSILTVPNILLDDEGLYSCIASNTAGEDRADSNIIVNTAPEIINVITELNVTVGGTTNINCTVFGSPHPSIYWQRYGDNITDERYIIAIGVFFSVLSIRDTVIKDFGEYICVAVNKEGETSQIFVINVFAPPTLYVESATCIASGFPQPNVLWFNDTSADIIVNSSSVIITEETLNMFTIRSSLWVTHLLSGNRGLLFHCGAENSEGSTSILDGVTSCAEMEPNVRVWFELLSYTVEESCTALSLCVVASTVQKSFYIQIHPISGTATANEDFNGQVSSIGFGVGKHPKQCTYIVILDDNVVENVEYFTAALRTPYKYVDVLTAAANITIIPDDDYTALQFEHPFYNMLEGENTSVCIVSKEGIQRAVEVNVIPSSQSDLELTTVQTMIGRKYCFTISAIDDEDVETKESVTLHLYSNDSSIHYTISSTTVIISDNDGGNAPDTTLRYKYGYPEVHPLYVIAYFEAGVDLKLENCKLFVEGGQQSQKNCSNGYVVFYFEDFAEETPYTLMIEGSRLDGQREPFSLSTVFHLHTITTCSVYLINDGITLYENSVVLEWKGTGGLNYMPNLFSYECKVNDGDQQLCSSPYMFSELSKGQHQIQIRHIENQYLCLDTPWQTYYVDLE